MTTDNPEGQTGTATAPPAPELTPEATPAPSFTQEQLDQAVKAGQNSALSAAGRDAKALEDARKVNQAERVSFTAERTAYEQERSLAEEVVARKAVEEGTQPNALTELRERNERQRYTSDLARQKAEQDARQVEQDAREAEFTTAQRTVDAARIATELGVDPKLLLDYTTGVDLETMRRLGESLTKSAMVNGVPPDSGTSMGGESITAGNVEDMMSRINEFTPERQAAITAVYKMHYG